MPGAEAATAAVLHEFSRLLNAVDASAWWRPQRQVLIWRSRLLVAAHVRDLQRAARRAASILPPGDPGIQDAEAAAARCEQFVASVASPRRSLLVTAWLFVSILLTSALFEAFGGSAELAAAGLPSGLPGPWDVPALYPRLTEGSATAGFLIGVGAVGLFISLPWLISAQHALLRLPAPAQARRARELERDAFALLQQPLPGRWWEANAALLLGAVWPLWFLAGVVAEVSAVGVTALAVVLGGWNVVWIAWMVTEAHRRRSIASARPPGGAGWAGAYAISSRLTGWARRGSAVAFIALSVVAAAQPPTSPLRWVLGVAAAWSLLASLRSGARKPRLA